MPGTAARQKSRQSFIFSHNAKTVKLKCIMCLSLGLQLENVVGVHQMLPSHPRPRRRKWIILLYADSPTSCKGVHLDSSKWVSEIFQRTNFYFVWNCHSSGRCLLQDWNYRSNNLFYDWYCAPHPTPTPPAPNGVNVHFDECFVECRSSVVAVSTMCSVLLFRIASSKLQPRATISMHLNWSLYIILHIR